ncbi:hypothetical protein DS901_05630 [Loktanella sp. D2R18]|uniref:hypothetical protein n=1 Tax=Rhodobacterales TaxID=204455 RepID=UPI000DE82C65|nr:MULTISPECIES: hypothetical protein [Rhodobacterales]MCG3267559.1 hypothetical protein [Yoonia sp. I 8.24]MDO6590658.1 hypothetical protein [Yoonia sp. 1_MG-2023]RBW44716.1 hypothetical protein DS901_05630 [Loktanella sp. D2R18]
MEHAFEIAGIRCDANEIRLRGRSVEAQFAPDAAGPLTDAFSNNMAVAFLGASAMNALYSVDAIETENGACRAVFSMH